MSRVGKLPVAIPDGVKAMLSNGAISIEGPKGKLDFQPSKNVSVKIGSKEIEVEKLSANRQGGADFGTTRAIIKNMVEGVTKGWKRSLELNGVGYTAKIQGSKLVLSVDLSHDVEMDVPNDIKCVVNKNVIELESANRQSVGTFASMIRAVKKPEPYLGKGIKYSEEVIRRKAGKTGKK